MGEACLCFSKGNCQRGLLLTFPLTKEAGKCKGMLTGGTSYLAVKNQSKQWSPCITAFSRIVWAKTFSIGLRDVTSWAK